MICVCWSPDGKYIVTGGQDDLVTIWSFPEQKIIARCQGHNSWVSTVAFDPWRCDERTYRFGSVGDDCRLLLWDFSVGMLHRPKAVRQNPSLLAWSYVENLRLSCCTYSLLTNGYPLQLQATARQRNSIVASGSHLSRHQTDSTSHRKRSDSNRTEKPDDDEEEVTVCHPVEPRARTAHLPPIMVRIYFGNCFFFPKNKTTISFVLFSSPKLTNILYSPRWSVKILSAGSASRRIVS